MWAKRDIDPHACVLGLSGQVNKFDSNRLLLTVSQDDDDEYDWLDDE